MTHYDLFVLRNKIAYSIENEELKVECREVVLASLLRVIEEWFDIVLEALTGDDPEKQKEARRILVRIADNDEEVTLYIPSEIREQMKEKRLPPDLLIAVRDLEESYEEARIVN